MISNWSEGRNMNAATSSRTVGGSNIRRGLGWMAVALLTAGPWGGAAPASGDPPANPLERPGVVTMKGKPVTLLGPDLGVGATAPDFRVVDASFVPVRLSDFNEKVVLISAVPSLDTPVCSLQTKHFNDDVQSLPADVVVLTISMDLPFAQKRFCTAEKVDRVHVLSDHVWREFGERYGLLIKDMGLLARSVWVVGRDGKVLYREIVPEISHQPNYEAALAAVRQACAP